MAQKRILAPLAMPGGGKSEVVRYLEEKYKWPKVYGGQLTYDELNRRGLEHTKQNERIVREELRSRHGNNYYAEEMINMVLRSGKTDVVLVDGLYSWPEYKLFKQEYGGNLFTVHIYASPSVRYRRLASHPTRPLTLAESITRDYSEVEHLEKGGPIAMADFCIQNEGTKEQLYASLDEFVETVLRI
jgi:dephospho-CoA kinase